MSKTVSAGPRGYVWERHDYHTYLVRSAGDFASVGEFHSEDGRTITANAYKEGRRKFRTVRAAKNWLIKKARLKK